MTASRFLKAIGQTDPVAIIQLLPGPNPLQRIIEASREAGADDSSCDAAAETVRAFDELIRTVAGDRSSLKAMVDRMVARRTQGVRSAKKAVDLQGDVRAKRGLQRNRDQHAAFASVRDKRGDQHR